MINIPSDLRKNKDTIIGNMDLRECICLFLGLILAIGILYYVRVVIGYTRIVVAAFIAGIFVIPFLFIGFKRINGMKIDDYFKVYINNKIIANSNRINACPYQETKISNKKYEIVRHYKLVDKAELLYLRQHLLDKKALILTEYIDYNGEQYAIFRLDAKDMILEQIRKNKELRSKNRRIKKMTFKNSINEFDIFDGMEGIKAERVIVKKSSNKKGKKINFDDNMMPNLSADERTLHQLHLFEREKFRDFINSINDKIVFINKDDEIDLFYYDDSNDTGARIARPYEEECDVQQTRNRELCERHSPYAYLIDTYQIDKKLGIYQDTILGFDARNYYNHYRKISSLEEIL